ncbi:MAG TPA: tripartite tricarboxylate transporter substrate binding protein [Burkholderiales bacterium]|nr:tripartite tricarboxylate transporter substrate binding protein [Burkholderiales bacterium]
MIRDSWVVIRPGLLLAALAVASAAQAQTYPTKPIRVIVPFAPGGPADIQGRLIGPKLTEAWGQPIVIENRAGGNTLIGTEVTARADPDGHTVELISASFAINTSLYAKLPYDSVRDFAPVTQLTSGPAIVVVHPSLPAKNIKELIQLARSRPGQIVYGSAGLPSQLAVELFKVLTGTDLLHVPYKGQGPAMIDLVAGHVSVSFPTILGALAHYKAGRLRALATTGAKRAAAAPELPTVTEAGVPGYEAANWFGITAPGKTPPAIVSKLSQEIGRALAMPDVRERLLTQGMEPVSNTPEVFSAYIRSEMTKWAKVVKASGARAE